MTDEPNKAPCRCYHDFEDHCLDPDGQLSEIGEGQCYQCYIWGFDCNNYVQDNLKYLEMQYDKRAR